MSQVAITPEKTETDAGSKHDRFIPVTLRRSRFVAAILISAALFWSFGWMLAAPPAPHQTFTLLGWGASPIVPMLGLLALVLVATILSMLITHPDTPHAGLFCALLGMSSLAIRGGTIYPLLRIGDDATTVHGVYIALAQECAMWAGILFITELLAGMVHARIFTNRIWMERVAQDPDAARKLIPGRENRGLVGAVVQLANSISKAQADKLKQDQANPMNIAVANFLALALATAAAWILLAIFLQSQGKGQVLFAAFISFGLAGFLANLALSQSNAWPIILCVPLTAAIGYLFANSTLQFPGFSVTHFARALPVDYLVAGVPGALYGYYGSVRLRLSHLFDEEE